MEKNDADLVQVKIRMRERLRAQIEASAKEWGTSISADIVARVERTLEEDQQRSLRVESFGQTSLVRTMARCWALLEDHVGQDWSDIAVGRALMRYALMEVIAQGIPSDDLSQEEQELLDRAKIIADEVVDTVTQRKIKGDGFMLNKLLAAAYGPINFVEAHNRWRRGRQRLESASDERK